ncbi:hypothetical protein K438DRAFT_1931134 [Mycena galopus ATCC 62051]|nr:hypothetical protein K438DRAFT_1931134 [Mycena galopus ATCC 62051]
MSDVQADTARLIALFVGCVLYGILLTTFVPCLRSLLFSASQKFQVKSRHEIKFPILAATILMFLVSSLSAVVSMQDVLNAFINYNGPGGAFAFYSGAYAVNAGWMQWIPAVEDSVQVALGDGLLIYRCYVLYDRNWHAIAVPAVCWITLVVLSIMGSIREATLQAGETLNNPTVFPFLTATLLLTLMTSVVTTYLIIHRLLTVEFHSKIRGAIQSHILTRIATIFFETGVIYTLSVIASLGVYLAKSNLEYVATLAMIHIIPITCNLLLIRVEGVNHAKSPTTTCPQISSLTEKFNPQAADEV